MLDKTFEAYLFVIIAAMACLFVIITCLISSYEYSTAPSSFRVNKFISTAPHDWSVEIGWSYGGPRWRWRTGSPVWVLERGEWILARMGWSGTFGSLFVITGYDMMETRIIASGTSKLDSDIFRVFDGPEAVEAKHTDGNWYHGRVHQVLGVGRVQIKWDDERLGAPVVLSPKCLRPPGMSYQISSQISQARRSWVINVILFLIFPSAILISMGYMNQSSTTTATTTTSIILPTTTTTTTSIILPWVFDITINRTSIAEAIGTLAAAFQASFEAMGALATHVRPVLSILREAMGTLAATCQASFEAMGALETHVRTVPGMMHSVYADVPLDWLLRVLFISFACWWICQYLIVRWGALWTQSWYQAEAYNQIKNPECEIEQSVARLLAKRPKPGVLSAMWPNSWADHQIRQNFVRKYATAMIACLDTTRTMYDPSPDSGDLERNVRARREDSATVLKKAKKCVIVLEWLCAAPSDVVENHMEIIAAFLKADTFRCAGGGFVNQYCCLCIPVLDQLGRCKTSTIREHALSIVHMLKKTCDEQGVRFHIVFCNSVDEAALTRMSVVDPPEWVFYAPNGVGDAIHILCKLDSGILEFQESVRGLLRPQQCRAESVAEKITIAVMIHATIVRLALLRPEVLKHFAGDFVYHLENECTRVREAALCALQACPHITQDQQHHQIVRVSLHDTNTVVRQMAVEVLHRHQRMRYCRFAAIVLIWFILGSLPTLFYLYNLYNLREAAKFPLGFVFVLQIDCGWHFRIAAFAFFVLSEYAEKHIAVCVSCTVLISFLILLRSIVEASRLQRRTDSAITEALKLRRTNASESLDAVRRRYEEGLEQKKAVRNVIATGGAAVCMGVATYCTGGLALVAGFLASFLKALIRVLNGVKPTAMTTNQFAVTDRPSVAPSPGMSDLDPGDQQGYRISGLSCMVLLTIGTMLSFLFLKILPWYKNHKVEFQSYRPLPPAYRRINGAARWMILNLCDYLLDPLVKQVDALKSKLAEVKSSGMQFVLHLIAAAIRISRDLLAVFVGLLSAWMLSEYYLLQPEFLLYLVGTSEEGLNVLYFAPQCALCAKMFMPMVPSEVLDGSTIVTEYISILFSLVPLMSSLPDKLGDKVWCVVCPVFFIIASICVDIKSANNANYRIHKMEVDALNADIADLMQKTAQVELETRQVEKENADACIVS